MLEDGKFTTPNEVASYILNLVDRASGEAITHLKLQKIVYYAEAWFLANFDRPLFEESTQAWAHGPVYRSIYDRFKGNKWGALAAAGDVPMPPDTIFDYLYAVCEEYGQYGAKKLEEMTHNDDPWKETRGELAPEARCEARISKLLIRNFYAARLGKEELKEI